MVINNLTNSCFTNNGVSQDVMRHTGAVRARPGRGPGERSAEAKGCIEAGMCGDRPCQVERTAGSKVDV